MKMLSNEVYQRIRRYVFLYARYLDIARWRFHFENGSADEVSEALSFYQNEDGGFGYGIELDCQNPLSQPTQFFWGAAGILKEIGYDTHDNPMMKKILRYIENCPDITEQGIRFVVPSNNEYPCNFWYKYEPDENHPAECNINSGIGFIFEHFTPDSAIYKKAVRIAEYRFSIMEDILKTRLDEAKDEWQGLEPSDYASLIIELKRHCIKTEQECRTLSDRLLSFIKTHGTAHTYDMIEKQIKKGMSTANAYEIVYTDDLDALIDKLSGDDQPWNNKGRLLDGEDNSQKYAQMYNIGMWWAIMGAISDLKVLKSHDRLERSG